MIDFIKRICIALALALFIGMLFVGTTYTFAHENEELPEELIEAHIWPTVGDVTDTYGTRNGKHYGIDIAAEKGTPVISIETGVVTRSYYSDTYGHVIFVEHENGLETVYAHLNARLVDELEVVDEGQLIGTVGTTGESSGNHLHFEVHYGNWNIEKSESIDPFEVLSTEPEYMYAALGEASPYGSDWRSRNSITVSSNDQHRNSDGMIVVKVKRGDTISKIAYENNVSVQEVMNWNQLENDVIYHDQELELYPDKNRHVVKEGETLTAIADKYQLSIEGLQKLNKLQSDLITTGQSLVIDK